MNAAERVKSAETYFQKLTGSAPNYKMFIPYTGKAALSDSSEVEDNVSWQAELVRKFDKHAEKEEYPTGEVSSFKLGTEQILPSEDKTPRARVITKIDYLCRPDASMDERIAEAIYAQDNLRDNIENREECFRVLDLLTASNDILVRNIDGIPKLTVHLRKQDKKGEDAEFPFVTYQTLGKNGSDKSIVKAEALDDHRMRDVLPLIDLQIKKLNGALTNPVKVPIEL